jgi:PAS domain S-box-containing protein
MQDDCRADNNKRHENVLRQSSEVWESIFQAIEHPAFILDRNYKVIAANKATIKLTGKPSNEIIGGYCYELFHGKDINSPVDSCPMERMLKSNRLETTEFEIDILEGTYLVSCIPILDNQGNLDKVIHIANDITDSRRVEKKLRRSEELLQSDFDRAPVGRCLVGVDGRFLKVNNTLCNMLGYSESELLSKTFREVTYPDDLAQSNEWVEKLLAGSATSMDLEKRYLHKAGYAVWGTVRVILLRDNVGSPLFFSSYIQDITEHKQMELTLKASEEKFRAISSAAADAILLMDNDGRITYWNAASEKIFGYSSEEAIGQDLHMLIAPARYYADYKRGFSRFKISGQGLVIGNTLEFMALRKDGTEFPIEVATSVMHFDGQWSAVGIVRDITERKKAEEALQASETELHDNLFAQATINMILEMSLENIPLEDFLQKALDMILSVPWLTFEPIGNIQLTEDGKQMLVMKAESNMPEAAKKASEGVPFGQCLCGKAALTQQIQFTDRDECFDICHEGMLPYGHYAVPIVFSGRTLGVLNIFLKEEHVRSKKEEDFLLAVADTLSGIITRRQIEDEKEKLHAQLLQAQKMEAVGQLAGGIAHDFNNILTAMIGYGHLLKMKMQEDDPLRSYADQILALSDRAANLTQSLLAFSRKQIMNPKTVDLNEIIRKVERLLVRIIGEDIELKTELANKQLTVLTDALQMEQVFMNLATNARDAMPEGGTLEIVTGTVELDELFIKTHGYGKTGQYAIISVSDTGSGIDENTQKHIFEPFFTTKEVGKGTGLGLAMAYGIIKQHEGYINVYSEPGRGTTFRIYLPLIKAETEPVKHEAPEPLETGTETVLLVEDETEVRELTKNLLKEYGYKVITAVDGQDGIEEFTIHEDKIQLVLLDVIMPKKNGKEVYDALHKIRPDIKVLFMSGYPGDIIYKRGLLDRGLPYIEKPTSPEKLLRKIREVLRT